MKKRAAKIDEFVELSIEAFESDNESVYEELGVSKDEYLKDKLNMIKRLKMKSLAQLNKTKNEEMLEIALQKVQSIIASASDKLKEGLEGLIRTQSPQFQFRNIEKLDKDDLKELLSDLDVIEIIEDLDKLEDADK
ncbi:hypothetical protein [Prolixibacter sp. SD074]|jgi:hypothetical protein|uniref:hypothetical protein n=1 Tax=Prolixibacter sp. SD074 TaxID=2652391 RepID=UPI0012836E96|nr:hypothetical protein [Prolixibacter sp. SD074]GET30793.1 hypothetical protein SD074_29950 [Prolixibacter sp. SD074]